MWERGGNLKTPIIRVLVADDYEPWRRFASLTLQTQPQLQVVGEASEGIEAIAKAQELQPDLTLLDISLPKINGIEVARQILARFPQTKILFVSLNNSPDIAETALSTGAGGYLVKSDAGTQLLPAIRAVLDGKRFVSARLRGRDLSMVQRQQARRETVVAPIPPENVAIRHEVEFYPDDLALVKGFARLTEAILGVGNIAVVIANENQRYDVLQRLRARGVKVDMAIEQQNYISLDATELLSTVMVHGMPDEVRLKEVIGGLTARVAKDVRGEYPRVAICGACAPTLLQEGKVEAAIRLEHLWDQTTSSYGVDTLCAYLWSEFPNHGGSPIFARICAEHSAVQGRALGY
jgi:DNA-binding NarL/FixJ family response regulator